VAFTLKDLQHQLDYRKITLAPTSMSPMCEVVFKNGIFNGSLNFVLALFTPGVLSLTIFLGI
jgi:hypothetical protein